MRSILVLKVINIFWMSSNHWHFSKYFVLFIPLFHTMKFIYNFTFLLAWFSMRVKHTYHLLQASFLWTKAEQNIFCNLNGGLPNFYIWVTKGVNFRTATFRRKPSFCVSNFLYGFLHVICARTCARINVYYSIITF